MDRLKGIEYFKRIVELGSFTAVADEFGCSNAVISKYMRFLEDWTGVRLVNRNTRTIRMTEEGLAFYDYCVQVLTGTTQMLDSLDERDTLDGTLVVACPVSLSVRILAPALFRFQQKHPELVVRLRLSDEMSNLIAEGVDLAIRGTGTLDDSTLVAARVGDMPRCLVAAPDYLERHGAPRSVQELATHRCLIFSLSQDSQQWEFGDGQERQTVAVNGPIIADNSLMLIEAARAGLGIAMVPSGYVHSEIANGDLVKVSLTPAPTPRTIYAVYPARQHLPRRARLFVDHLKEELAT